MMVISNLLESATSFLRHFRGIIVRDCILSSHELISLLYRYFLITSRTQIEGLDLVKITILISQIGKLAVDLVK